MNAEGPRDRNEVLERVLAQWPEEHNGRIVALLQLQGNLLEKHAGSWGLFPATTAGHWVVATNDSEGERRARETVEAFVGPLTGSITISGRPGNGDESGEAWLTTQGATTLFDLVPGDDRGGLLPAIELLVTVRSNQPPSSRNHDEPVQFLIREFYLALHNGNSEASGDLLRRIGVTGRLSALNLLFLKVERLARFEHWDQLEQLEEFEDLAIRQRPRRISEKLLEALWHTRLSSRSVDEPTAIRNRFSEIGVAAGYPHLLGAIDVPASFGARRIVALFCQETDDPDRLARVIASATQAEGELLRQLVGSRHEDRHEHETVPPTHLSGSPVTICHKAFNACEYVKVLDVAEEHPDEPECRPLAVRAASESGDRELCSRVVELIGADGSNQLTGDELLSGLSGEEATELLRSLSLPEAEQFRLLLLQVIRIAEHRCTGWVDWMERIAGDEPWAMGATVARDDATAWAVDELLVGSMPGRASELLLDGISGVNRKELLGALDLLCDLYTNIVRHSASGPIRTAIIMLLSEVDRPSPQVREAFLTLSSANLDGADAASYKSFVETAKAIWEEVKSDAALEWALGFADHLLAIAPPDPQIRVDFINQIVVWVWEEECRLTEWHRNWLSLICKDAGISAELKPAAEPRQGEMIKASCWDRLAGKLVGLYMLDERTASRFKALLPKRSPGAEPVETDSSHEANERLRGIAQRSDYMIVCWQCSKHPATRCIDEVRDRGLQIWPDGRRCPGVTGLFRCLENVLQTELDGESDPVGL